MNKCNICIGISIIIILFELTSFFAVYVHSGMKKGDIDPKGMCTDVGICSENKEISRQESVLDGIGHEDHIEDSDYERTHLSMKTSRGREREMAREEEDTHERMQAIIDKINESMNSAKNHRATIEDATKTLAGNEDGLDTILDRPKRSIPNHRVKVTHLLWFFVQLLVE